LDRPERLGLESVLVADHADDGPGHALAEVGRETELLDPLDDVPDHLRGRLRLQHDDHRCPRGNSTDIPAGRPSETGEVFSSSWAPNEPGTSASSCSGSTCARSAASASTRRNSARAL